MAVTAKRAAMFAADPIWGENMRKRHRAYLRRRASTFLKDASRPAAQVVDVPRGSRRQPSCVAENGRRDATASPIIGG